MYKWIMVIVAITLALLLRIAVTEGAPPKQTNRAKFYDLHK